MSTSADIIETVTGRKRSKVLEEDSEEEEIKRRPRLSSIKSDKAARYPIHELTDLETQVVEVLNKYSNGTTSLRTDKIDADLLLAS